MARACARRVVPTNGAKTGTHLRTDSGGGLVSVPGIGTIRGRLGPERSLLGSVPLLPSGVVPETPVAAELGSEQGAMGTLPSAVPYNPVPIGQSPGMSFEDDTTASPLLEPALPGGD